MLKCVSCLGNWRKQTFQSWDPGLRLQSKLWKQNLRALNRGPHPGRKSGIPPASTPPPPCSPAAAPPVEGSSILTLTRTPWQRGPGVAQLRKAPALFVLADKMVQSVCALSLGPCCVLLSWGAVPALGLLMLLVSGTFFFPTSEINEISISHLAKVIMPPFFFFSPNKWHLVQFQCIFLCNFEQ